MISIQIPLDDNFLPWASPFLVILVNFSFDIYYLFNISILEIEVFQNSQAT